ncbi:MAG: protein-methionine-sulfoxide reductase catalytic subunit MsrP, partial [Planctomycetota bacterium]
QLFGRPLLGPDGQPLQKDDEPSQKTSGGKSPSGDPKKPLYPAKRNSKYRLDRRLTAESFATSYNNFYEFTFGKTRARTLAQRMKTSPWKIEISGLVKKPMTIDVDQLMRKVPLEERLYRFRCVEAWAMAVPWTGFPLRALLELVEPLRSAKYVRFETFNKPDWGQGFLYKEYPWPYHEALTIDEASNELALMATGLYGKPLPKQNGAPIRLVVPWKYGFKSIKSIVKIELVEKKPETFWNTVIPEEYGFEANVNPDVPHPRWSQAFETLIDSGKRVETQLYNGYADQVAHLYQKGPAKAKAKAQAKKPESKQG